ncbi:MAG: hypothetical protein E6Q90_01560 [Actinobacteria bacterium]|nr:MAG: hypothetical protein E6Q90_01560 [Actinomycetota bacterium]
MAADDPTRTGRLRRAVVAFVRSPVSGVLPWVPTAAITGADSVALAVGVSLAISLLTAVATVVVGDRIKALETFDIVYFAVVGLVVSASGADVDQVVARWLSEVSLLVILVYAVGSVAIGRPFTSQYSRVGLTTGQAGSDLFRRWNSRATTMWAVVFAVQLASMYVAESILADPDDLVFGWIIPLASLASGFALDARMTRRYRSAIIQ